MSASPAIPESLIDCFDPADGELFVVEGLSATNALKSLRDRHYQAVVSMQGKIPNANRTPPGKLLSHPKVGELLRCIHPDFCSEPQPVRFRFKRVLLLGDPDADGLHATLLLVLFLMQYAPALIEQGRLYIVRAPLFGFYHQEDCVALAYSEQHAEKVAQQLGRKYSLPCTRRRFKGVASLDENQRLLLLSEDNATRHQLSMMDCRQLSKSIAS